MISLASCESVRVLEIHRVGEWVDVQDSMLTLSSQL
jgi:hypothetical protein